MTCAIFKHGNQSILWFLMYPDFKTLLLLFSFWDLFSNCIFKLREGIIPSWSQVSDALVFAETDHSRSSWSEFSFEILTTIETNKVIDSIFFIKLQFQKRTYVFLSYIRFLKKPPQMRNLLTLTVCLNVKTIIRCSLNMQKRYACAIAYVIS